ncbi:hypothetical protein [Amycolatopsis australiensis]|uniref:PH domain-containing protein n=1 Tax=Amycolatopsis australiensis TaxID=546364 RepID=A0A1K1QP71_9PSEU|nr:hypothetical protein [Amycolatopsis australiensis]SFW61435.1 hypothetical protein SAMN04489730_2019 [Amycolatopsis australiensis]
MTDAFADLGPVLTTHRVDNARRVPNAAWSLTIAALTGALGWWALSGGSDGSRAHARLVGVVLGITLVGLVIGARQVVALVRGGSTEYFEVREHGLVHASRREISGWSWDKVTRITIVTRGIETGLSRQLGSGYRAELRFEGGGRVRFDGLTRDHAGLGRVVLARCPAAERRTGDEWQRERGGLLLALAGLCLAVTAGAVAFLATRGDDAPFDGLAVFATLGALVCFLAAVTCVGLFVRGRLLPR